jgi:hypothetical protein
MDIPPAAIILYAETKFSHSRESTENRECVSSTSSANHKENLGAGAERALHYDPASTVSPKSP